MELDQIAGGITLSLKMFIAMAEYIPSILSLCTDYDLFIF